jgi:hypothetical protein
MKDEKLREFGEDPIELFIQGHLIMMIMMIMVMREGSFFICITGLVQGMEKFQFLNRRQAQQKKHTCTISSRFKENIKIDLITGLTMISKNLLLRWFAS